jgi:hypothetical protein
MHDPGPLGSSFATAQVGNKQLDHIMPLSQLIYAVESFTKVGLRDEGESCIHRHAITLDQREREGYL